MRAISHMIAFAMAVCVMLDMVNTSPASALVQARAHQVPAAAATMLAAR